MRIKVLPFVDLKKRQGEFDVIVTVLDPFIRTHPDYQLPILEGQTHISVWCSDSVEDRVDFLMVAPKIEQFARILKQMKPFIRTKASVCVACMAGISRSSATALMLLVAEAGSVDVAMIRWSKLERSRMFWPNSLIIKYADTLLNQNGKLIQAVASHKRSNPNPLFILDTATLYNPQQSVKWWENAPVWERAKWLDL